MRCRVTNDQKGPRVIYDTRRKPIIIEPGKSAEFDIDDDTYETHRAMALAKCGPQIELLADNPKEPTPSLPPSAPTRAATPDPAPPSQPQSTPEQAEDTGEDVMGEPPPVARRTTRGPAKRKSPRPRGHASVQME
jgi:hypothetical protein